MTRPGPIACARIRGASCANVTVPHTPHGRYTSDTVIQLSSLTKAFGDRTLLDHVTWQIDDRERVGLSGPNGAGKTTLLRMNYKIKTLAIEYPRGRRLVEAQAV